MATARRIIESDSQEDTDYETYVTNKSSINVRYDKGTMRKSRCFSKNALMARENRLKKKMYVNNLEKNISKLTRENRILQLKVEKQSDKISELLKEVCYVKSVLANSTDISKILQSIHHNTGMLVRTSMDKPLSFINNYVSNKETDTFENSPESLLGSDSYNFGSLFDNPEINLFNIEEDLPQTNSSFNTFEEHNYTTHLDPSDDAGVCLHVSKHRVSLEFCSKCSENSANIWADQGS